MSVPPLDCASCGEPLTERARFCRSCGAPVAGSPPPPKPKPKPPPVPPPWPLAASAAPDADNPPPPPPAASVRSPPRVSLVVGLVVLVAFAASAGAAAGLLLTRDDEPGSTARGGASATSSGDGPPAAPPVSDAIVAGRYVQLGSYRGSTGATAEARRLTAAGLAAKVYDSNDVAELQPAFFVILAGPFSTVAQQRSVVLRAQRSGVAGAPRHTLSPAPLDGDAPAGRYTGTLSRKAEAGSPLNRAIDATMDFAPGGETGAIAFSTPSCAGELRLAETTGSVRRYDEAITSGTCPTGGTWSVRTTRTELLVTWWHPDRRYFVIGTLATS